MFENVENTSLFEILDDAPIKLEVILETEATSEIYHEVPNSVREHSLFTKGVDRENLKGVKKVRNNLTNKRPRKLPNLSSPPGLNRQAPREESATELSPVLLQNEIDNRGHHVSPDKSTGEVELLSRLRGTVGSSESDCRFQSKAQLFDHGEGAALLRRGFKKSLAKRKGRRKLPTPPDYSMDIIDKVQEANRTFLEGVDEERQSIQIRGTKDLTHPEEERKESDRSDLQNPGFLIPSVEDNDDGNLDRDVHLQERENKPCVDINLNISSSPVDRSKPQSQKGESANSTTKKVEEETKDNTDYSQQQYLDQLTKGVGEKVSRGKTEAAVGYQNNLGISDTSNRISTPESEESRSDFEINRDRDLRNKEDYFLKEEKLRELSDSVGSVEGLGVTETIKDLTGQQREPKEDKPSQVCTTESSKRNRGMEQEVTADELQLETINSNEIIQGESEEGGDTPRADNQLFHMLLDEYEDDFDEESTSRSISIVSDDHRATSDNDLNFEGDHKRAPTQKILRRTDPIDEGDEGQPEEDEKMPEEMKMTGEDVDHQTVGPEITTTKMADNSEHTGATETEEKDNKVKEEQELVNGNDGITSHHETEISHEEENVEEIVPPRDNGNMENFKQEEIQGEPHLSSTNGSDFTRGSYPDDSYIRDVIEILEPARQGDHRQLHSDRGEDLSTKLGQSNTDVTVVYEDQSHGSEPQSSNNVASDGTSVDSGVLNDAPTANLEDPEDRAKNTGIKTLGQTGGGSPTFVIKKDDGNNAEVTKPHHHHHLENQPAILVKVNSRSNEVNSRKQLKGTERGPSAISKQGKTVPVLPSGTDDNSSMGLSLDSTTKIGWDDSSMSKDVSSHDNQKISASKNELSSGLSDLSHKSDRHQRVEVREEEDNAMAKVRTVMQGSKEGKEETTGGSQSGECDERVEEMMKEVSGGDTLANETKGDKNFERSIRKDPQKMTELSVHENGNNNRRIERVIHSHSETGQISLHSETSRGESEKVTSSQNSLQETLRGGSEDTNGGSVQLAGNSETDFKAKIKVHLNESQSMKPRKSALKVRQGPEVGNYPSSVAQFYGTDVKTGIVPNACKAPVISDEDTTPRVGVNATIDNVTEVNRPGKETIDEGNARELTVAVQRDFNDKNVTHETDIREDEPRKQVTMKKKAPVAAQNGQQHHNSDRTNRHEGHNCPRELRRLERLKEQQMADNAVTSEQMMNKETGRTKKSEGTIAPEDEADGDDEVTTFPGQRSQEAASSPLIADSPPAKRRRKKKSDPFDGLPVIKPWRLHQEEQSAIKERPKGRRRHERRFKVAQFEDPFSQMVWMLFRSADKDGNNKLNKKELGLILQSPKLELSLTPADVKKLFSDCCTDEDSDPKTYELSFEEFVPLGRFLLMVYYSKLDASSQSKWCILDKGKDCGLIYFNKLTGDASTTVPSDYHNDILHQPDLLELAIHDLFEDADINDDGKINLTDFLRVLRSEDFGLFLTNVDVEEIMQHFINNRGREIMVQFDEFVPLAKRMIMTVYKARDPSPHEWCHLYTKNVGSFWFNKRTGQADRHPPTSLVRTQQDMLEHRSKELGVFMEVAEDLHHTKENLQQETQMRQELEEQLAELQKEHEATIKELAKTTSSLEKSQEEVDQKTKQIIYFEKEKVKHQNLIESLQDRAEEADRIEANLESLRNVLQSTQTTVREKEFDVRDLSENVEEKTKQLANSQAHAANLQDKIDDLVVQLRDEIRRNERVEKELERTKSYKSEKVEVEDILKETKEELQLRMNQLTHARYEIRDCKSRIRKLETELNSYPDLHNQLAEKDKEVSLLKEEMQRLETQMMEDIRRAVREPRPSVKRYRWNKLQNIETWDKSHSCSDPSCPINGRNPPGAESSQVWAFKKHEKTQTHPNGSFLELLNHSEQDEDTDADELNIYDLYEPHHRVASQQRVRAMSASGDRSRLVRPKSSTGRMETRRQSRLPKGVLLYEEDYLLARFVKEGDRVRIKKSGVQILGMKPSDLRTATVRYVGQLDQEGGEHMLFVGLHMDDPVGNTNGILEGKRYFYTKRKHGKMIRITEVLYIYNPKTTSFDKLSELIEEYKASRRKPWQQAPDEGSRLIKVT